MIHAYENYYLKDAQRCLSSFLDYGVNHQHIEISTLWNMFLNSEICDKFMIGDPFTISGKSGIELVLELLKINKAINFKNISFERSKEFWLGHFLAFFQWSTSLSFKKLNKYISIQELLDMYHPFHEMDIMHFVYHVKDKYNERKKLTNLELIRKEAKLSRQELSELSEVPIRIIEQYEQRVRNINKANATYVISLANTLRVKPIDLLEI